MNDGSLGDLPLLPFWAFQAAPMQSAKREEICVRYARSQPTGIEEIFNASSEVRPDFKHKTVCPEISIRL
jgi:hypothetical protein